MSDQTCPICRMPTDICEVGACPGALRGGFKMPYRDGVPYDMSQFRLGERYGSEDMYRDMGIRPGERVAYQGSDGLIYTGTVENITYSSGKPAIYPTLTRWQQLKRRLTPRRWRKPIKPIREATSDEFTITANKFDDGIGWAYVADDAPTPTGTIIDGIIKTEPGEPK